MKVRTATNQNGESIPAAALDTQRGVRVGFTDTASAATVALEAGVYLVSVSANAYVRISATGEAGDLTGSFVMPAGGNGVFVISQGQRVRARGIEGAGSVFAIPLKNA